MTARVTPCSKIAAYRPSASCPPPARSKIFCRRSAVANDRTIRDERNRPQGSDITPVSVAARSASRSRPVSRQHEPRASSAARATEGVGAFAQARKLIDLGSPRAGASDAVRFERSAASRPAVASSATAAWRSTISARGAGRNSQSASVVRPRGRGRRPEPLKERGAAEEIEIERVRVIGQVDASRRHRRLAARASRARGATCARRFTSSQRVDATRRALRRARARRRARRRRRRALPRSPAAPASRRATASRPACRRGEERRQPQTRDASASAARSARPSLRVARCVFRVWNRRAAHAACSDAAGLVAARFRRQ